MTNKTKYLIGGGILAVGAFLYWKSKQPKTTTAFANAGGSSPILAPKKKLVGVNGAAKSAPIFANAKGTTAPAKTFFSPRDGKFS